jgi:hypothetical protein
MARLDVQKMLTEAAVVPRAGQTKDGRSGSPNGRVTSGRRNSHLGASSKKTPRAPILNPYHSNGYGAAWVTRTPDLRITNAPLYRLS